MENTLLESLFSVQAVILVLVIVALKMSIKFVPQNRAYVIERFGKSGQLNKHQLNIIGIISEVVFINQSIVAKNLFAAWKHCKVDNGEGYHRL